MNDHQKNETRGVAGVATDLIRESFLSFIADDALSRGASIAFYVVTSIVPVLVIIVAIAGAVYGREAAQGAIAAELSGVMGREGADLLQAAIHDASGKSAGVVASALGVITLLITSSGVFGEMQSALNVIWKASPKGGEDRLLLTIALLSWVVPPWGSSQLRCWHVEACASGYSSKPSSLIPPRAR